MSAAVRLRDGSEVVIRPIEPDDREQLAAEFARLSPESRYRRFLAPAARLSEETLDYLTEVDHHDHEALVALDTATGEGAGVGRFVRLPDRPEVAEAAVTVADAWQGRGLGTLLLELLAGRARQEGIERFIALMLAENTEMMELLQNLGPVRVVDRELGTVEVESQLPASGLGPELRALLRLWRRASAARRRGRRGEHCESCGGVARASDLRRLVSPGARAACARAGSRAENPSCPAGSRLTELLSGRWWAYPDDASPEEAIVRVRLPWKKMMAAMSASVIHSE